MPFKQQGKQGQEYSIMDAFLTWHPKRYKCRLENNEDKKILGNKRKNKNAIPSWPCRRKESVVDNIETIEPDCGDFKKTIDDRNHFVLHMLWTVYNRSFAVARPSYHESCHN